MNMTEKEIVNRTNRIIDEREDYWMVDYSYESMDEGRRWIRSSFLRWNQVVRMMANLNERFTSNILKNYTDESFENVSWGSVRIQSERDLDEMVDENGKTESEVEFAKTHLPSSVVSLKYDYEWFPFCSKREYRFGGTYQGYADGVRSGRIDPAKQAKGWKDESLCDYEELISDLRADYPDGIDWEEYDAFQKEHRNEVEAEVISA